MASERDGGDWSDVSDSDVSDLSSDDEVSGEVSWVSWFCSLKGNELFCEVDDDYIQDDFNLSGLSMMVPYYEYALDMILDLESQHADNLRGEQHEIVETAAEMLYGMIHARFILTTRGLACMMEKYKEVHFGRCPRVLCGGQQCLPIGQSDVPHTATVKLYCPKCQDIYYPRSRNQGSVDGAYFGTTFPHLFLMTYPSLRVSPNPEVFVPKVFGFKLHHSVLKPPGEEASKGGDAKTGDGKEIVAAKPAA